MIKIGNIMKQLNKKSRKSYISVIITAYNRKEYLIEAFKSTINQTLSRDKYEVIVSKNFKNKFLDEYIKENEGKLIYFEEGSIGEQLVDAIQYAKGEIICFLDDDDLFTKDKLKFVYSTFKKNKNLGYLHNYEYLIDKNGIILKGNLNKYKISKSFLLTNKYKRILKLIKIEQNYDPYFNMSSISIKRCILVGYLTYLKKLTTGPDDLMFFTSLDSKMNLYLCDKKLTYYRVHKSVSRDIMSYPSFRKNLLKEYERTYESLIPLLSKFDNKSIKLYLLYWLREKEIFYYFHKGNFRIIVIIDLIKNFPYMITSIPKRFVLRSAQVLFYLLSPERFRKFDYKVVRSDTPKN